MPDTYDYRWCDQLAQTGLDGVSVHLRYGWLAPYLVAALNSAEQAMCGADVQCITRRQHVRLIVVPQTAVSIGARHSADGLTIRMTTGYVDFVEATGSAMLFGAEDARARGGEDESLGLDAWLNALDNLGNRPCRFGFPSPQRPVRSGESFLPRISAMMPHSIFFAHELSHLALGSNCGVSDAAAVERACDANAIDSLLSTGTPPLVAVVFMVAMAHYRAEVAGITAPPPTADAGVVSTAVDAQEYRDRALALVDHWEHMCRHAEAGTLEAAFACGSGWQGLNAAARNVATRPLPAMCDATGVAPADFERPLPPLYPVPAGFVSRGGPLGNYCTSPEPMPPLFCATTMEQCNVRCEQARLRFPPDSPPFQFCHEDSRLSRPPGGNYCCQGPVGPTQMMCGATPETCETVRAELLRDAARRSGFPLSFLPCVETRSMWCGFTLRPGAHLPEIVCDPTEDGCRRGLAAQGGDVPDVGRCGLYQT